MKLASLLLGAAVAVAACGGDDDGDGGHGGDGGPVDRTDADPNKPDAGPLSERIFDHNHVNVEDISSGCLDQLTSGDFVFHYGHRSHGSQLIVGADLLEAAMPEFQFEEGYASIPGGSGALKMWDGMLDDNAVPQEEYWDSEEGLDDLREILTDNPEIKYTMWAWSFEISEQTEESVQRYLDTIDGLEGEFPEVRFIYMTGPMPFSDYEAINRMERNEQIRDFAISNGKLLYDFADLEVWHDGTMSTTEYSGEDVPTEHPDFRTADPGYMDTHTNEANCEQKARAFWGMMAVLECD